MKRLFTTLLILSFSFLCFAASILLVIWWKTAPLQVYTPPKISALKTKAVTKALFNIHLNGKKGCIDIEGNIIIEPKYNGIRCSTDELIPVEINEKWGYVNQSGELILEPQFYLANHGYSNNFSEGLAVVCMNGKCGYIDSSGNYVIEPKFDYAENFSDGFAIVGIGAFDFLGHRFRYPKTVFINKKGEIAFPDAQFTPEDSFSDGLARVTFKNKIGFIDKSGNFVISPQDKGINDFHEGLAVFSSEELYRFGYVDKTAQIVIPQQFKQAGEFSEGLATVMFENGKYGYIDETGKTVIEPQYDVADSFYEGRAVVCIGLKNGYIDKTGKEITPIQFGSAERFVNGLAQVSFDDENPPYENKRYGYIDKSGNFIWRPTN